MQLCGAIQRALLPVDDAGTLTFLISDATGVITGWTISAGAGLVLH